MLTLNSRFTNFSKRPNAVVTAADLDALKTIISTDLVNFRGNISYGFTEGIATKIVGRIKVSKDAKICVVNDTSFHMTLKLIEAGYDPANIYIAVGKWKVAGKRIVPDKNDSTLKILKRHAEASFVEKLNIISLEDMFNLKFNLIIANPPYSTIGAKITDVIRTNMDYDQFVNLLPANDYKRVTGLHNYVKDLVPFQAGSNFADAYVTTHLAEVCKGKVNNFTQEEFERKQYIDPTLDRYFEVLADVKHYAIDNAMYKPTFDEFAEYGVERAIYIGKRDPKSEHLPYSKKSVTTRFNMNQITASEVIEQSAKSEQKHGRVGDFYLVGFNTTEEKDNCAAFLYSADGFRFISKVFVALNIDSSIPIRKWMPKVDWTRSWTVEEILADYGYTVDEIAEVMSDLENFKGMEG